MHRNVDLLKTQQYAFQLQQRPFGLKPAAVTRQRTIAADDAVTRGEDGDSIRAVCVCNCAHGFGHVNPPRHLSVGYGLPEGNIQKSAFWKPVPTNNRGTSNARRRPVKYSSSCTAACSMTSDVPSSNSEPNMCCSRLSTRPRCFSTSQSHRHNRSLNEPSISAPQGDS